MTNHQVFLWCFLIFLEILILSTELETSPLWIQTENEILLCIATIS